MHGTYLFEAAAPSASSSSSSETTSSSPSSALLAAAPSFISSMACFSETFLALSLPFAFGGVCFLKLSGLTETV